MHKYDAKICEKEEEATMTVDLAKPKYAAIINENAKNKWGSPKGYKVQLSRPAHNLLPDSFSWNKGLGRQAAGGHEH